MYGYVKNCVGVLHKCFGRKGAVESLTDFTCIRIPESDKLKKQMIENDLEPQVPQVIQVIGNSDYVVGDKAIVRWVMEVLVSVCEVGSVIRGGL